MFQPQLNSSLNFDLNVKRRTLLITLGALTALTRAVHANELPVVLVLGDSLSAEYGLRRNSGWVKLLADRIEQSGARYRVVNASISGETTSGGLTRVPDLLKAHRPAVVVIELGANDGLRGLPIAAMRANLRAIIKACRATKAQVLLVGMRLPPNYGRAYAEQFFAAFGQIARDEKVAHVPFLLDGFAESAELFQADHIHPTEGAQPLMLDTVWPQLQPLLRERAS